MSLTRESRVDLLDDAEAVVRAARRYLWAEGEGNRDLLMDAHTGLLRALTDYNAAWGAKMAADFAAAADVAAAAPVGLWRRVWRWWWAEVWPMPRIWWIVTVPALVAVFVESVGTLWSAL